LTSKTNGLRHWRQRFAALFQDHEIFIRTHGQVRFLKVTARMQKRLALAVSAVLLLWIAITLTAVISQFLTAHDRVELSEKEASAAAAEMRIAAYRSSVNDLASELDARQAQLEEWQKAYFGNSPLPAEAEATATATADNAPKKISALGGTAEPADLLPEVQKLTQLAARQEALSEHLLAAVNLRASKAEVAVRKLGFNPQQMVRNANAQGGPFIPYPKASSDVADKGTAFAALDRALYRMEVLERTLVALPSGNPADVLMMSSGFGARRDPFNGAGAMHAGLDFRGPVGTAILAAAPGRVSFVGSKSGYGNVVEVDHGQGIMTRYAHLSGFTSKVGQKVAAGMQIAKMGSTGRSTGSHLHFEVRLNGVAVNPRRFLEAKADVLEVKADASERVGNIAGRAI
jgi:murein DD-endopeptidase MepM/ murein hydrolase activator NlpD